jgi:isoleucyl-tRNA synthetase
MEDQKKQEKSIHALREERILDLWRERDVFKKTLEKESSQGPYIFYEGPPTANAKPALHHLEARVFKDAIPRYKTMQGYSVKRRAGWDTHGLPVELQIEKKLGLTSKKEIEQYGIAQFNKECKESVFTYIKDWESFTDRIGYWVDKKNAYYTFNARYIESLWSIVGHIHKRDLLYKDYKVVPWCPRCGTGLSSHELAQPGAYQDDKDLTVTAKFKIKGTTNQYIIAWTTTPWTLPGNVALAVGSDITYSYIKLNEEEIILAKDRLSIIEGEYSVLKEVRGSDLVGTEYEPLYPYLSEQIPDKEKLNTAYKIYVADFVTTTDGTGVVHTAVMYGQDDFELGTKVGLPKFHTVDEAGHFISGTGFLEGRFVKDEEVAVDIIKDLAHRGLLFKKEKYEHSYPHCWRCKTPLIYYARNSWYIAMSKLREEAVKENEGINWEPAHIKEGRFGEWLKDLKDWAISRERYWGTPLPIWETEDGEIHVVDSLETLKKYSVSSKNTYYVMRHGQTENNVKELWNCDSTIPDPLTKEGEEKVYATAETLKDKNIDYIIASPFPRTQETAKIIAQVLGLKEDQIIADARLGEWSVGKEYDRKPLEDYFKIRNNSADRYNFKAPDGESYIDVLRRTGECLYEIESIYKGKNILFISHGAVTRSLDLIGTGIDFNTLHEQTINYRNFDNAEVRKIHFIPLPHNDNYELDLHRPYIDEVQLQTEDGKPLTRVKEVMDVWFDSGSMPFAQDHYPFENKGYIETTGYPADFISEAIDQTRGWFYTLHAIGVLMGKGKAYKNVICLGHILDSQGKKMSKSIGNIVEPWEQMNKYGVDAIRLWMYSVNRPGDSKNYDEKTVDEVVKKFFLITENVYKFYELYKKEDIVDPNNSPYVLDQWILSLIHKLIETMTEGLEKFDVFTATRSLRDFVTDLSTWYVRRSRDRLKEENEEGVFARSTLYYVLDTFTKLSAPFTPFFAEDLYQKLHDNTGSVHLESWPEKKPYNTEV